MKLGLRQIIVLVAAMLLPVIAPAQDLPKMPADPAIVQGVLPDGLSYYIISNSSEKGVASFSLVQKTGRRNLPDSVKADSLVVRTARESLSCLYRLGNRSAQGFFAAHGSHPGRDGFVSVREDATVFRFPDVRLSDGKTVLDSALLVLMDITDRRSFSDDDFVREWYSPSDQAIIVAGDVDPKTVISRLEGMSYMVPYAESKERMKFYCADSSSVSVSCAGGGSALREIVLNWVSERVPSEYMNTVQPVIFDRALDILGKVAVRRVKAVLEFERIPFANVSYTVRHSDEGPGDDLFALRFTVHGDDQVNARRIVASVMESIDAEGVSLDEYLLAEADFMSSLKREAALPSRSNADYTERCISSFLYNSFLSSSGQVYSFHTHRNLPDSVRCSFFNDVAAALLYPMDKWEESYVISDSMTFAAVPVLPYAAPKVKIRSVKKDHLSGGTIWTFSNGFKVVYRNMPSNGDVYYAMALNGGYSGIPGLSGGEGAYVSDLFRLSRIAGVKGDDFFEYLRKEQVIMEPHVTMSNTLIEGRLPKDRMPLLMQALLAVANSRLSDEDTFPYYKECEEMSLDYSQHSFGARMTAIDSIMCPGYRYSPYKSKGRLTSSFYQKASAFLDAQMGKMNDGVLVIVGDIAEESLKQQLMNYVGGFRTKDVTAKRTMLRYQPVSGWSTYTVKGNMDAVDVALSARLPLTSINYLAACIAVMVLEKDLAAAMSDSGMYFDVLFNCRIYPEERMNVLISAYSADAGGMALGSDRITPIDALGNVREALSELSLKDITDDQLKQYKAYLKNRIGLEMKDPLYWVDAITLRYLDGKDLTTGYAANIDALSKDDVLRVFALLDRGCKIEYVTTQ